MAARLFLATSSCALATAAVAGETTTYTYDALGRLVATSSSGSVNNGVATSIAYDPAGNRQSYGVSGVGASSGSTVSMAAGANTSATAQADGSYLLEKTGGGYGWNAEATSSQGLSGPFELKFVLPPGNPDNVAVGVSRNPSASASYDTIDFAITIQPNGLAWVYASGVAVSGAFNANGGPMWIVRDAAGVLTVRTGTTAASATVVYTAPGTQTGTFYVDSSFYAVGDKATVRFAATGAATPPGPSPLAGTNVTATVQSDGAYMVEKTGGGYGWNAEATSSQGASGAFSLKFVLPAGNPNNVAVGVSRIPSTSASYDTIDFAITTQPDGLSWVYVSGTGVNGAFNANGGPMWIVRDSAGVLTIRVGATAATATVVYTAPGTQSGTFYADSSFYAVGSRASIRFEPF